MVGVTVRREKALEFSGAQLPPSKTAQSHSDQLAGVLCGEADSHYVSNGAKHQSTVSNGVGRSSARSKNERTQGSWRLSARRHNLCPVQEREPQ
jgi:hypothetical protein